MIKINIEADHSIEDFEIEDLYKNTIQAKNNQDVEIFSDWFLIKIPYCNIKNEINKIKINNVDIEHLIYTGWFENNKNECFQPATAVWEPGYFKIWIHTNIGLYKFITFSHIANGDFGKNLFDEYMLTVDYSIDIDQRYSKDIREFFKHPFGPRWWKKNDVTRPYKVLKNEEFNNINKDALINDIKKVAKFANLDKKHWKYWSLKDGGSDLPLVSNDTFSGELKKLIDLIGFKSIIDVSIQTLDPKSTIHIHIDDHLSRECWPIIAGCKKFYWNLTDTTDIYFKLGEAGLIPIEYPLMINTAMHVHSLINDSDITRTVLLIYGDIDNGSNFKNLKIS